jgi:hypothetical protein
MLVWQNYFYYLFIYYYYYYIQEKTPIDVYMFVYLTLSLMVQVFSVDRSTWKAENPQSPSGGAYLYSVIDGKNVYFFCENN